MTNILLLPPLCFAIVFFTVWGIARMLAMLAPKPTKALGKEDAYACGEVYETAHIEPDYGAFFRFAIFFTIIDVAGLMVATLAMASFTPFTTFAAVIYTLAISAVLAILYSK